MLVLLFLLSYLNAIEEGCPYIHKYTKQIPNIPTNNFHVLCNICRLPRFMAYKNIVNLYAAYNTYPPHCSIFPTILYPLMSGTLHSQTTALCTNIDRTKIYRYTNTYLISKRNKTIAPSSSHRRENPWHIHMKRYHEPKIG